MRSASLVILALFVSGCANENQPHVITRWSHGQVVEEYLSVDRVSVYSTGEWGFTEKSTGKDFAMGGELTAIPYHPDYQFVIEAAKNTYRKVDREKK